MIAVFSLSERRNVFRDSGKEWALNVSLGKDTWTVIAFEKKPTKEEYKMHQALVLRSMEVYHNSLSIPPFSIESEER